MAKRKRLSPAVLSEIPSDLETKSALPPIANVAGGAASQAALDEVVDTLARARREGRMVLELPVEDIEEGYLVRDRTRVDAEEMQTLQTSIAQRGQQSPVEVADLGGGRYGLISGWRRLAAIRALGDRPVLALLRSPQDAPDAYLAMIEENEVRVGLSYYERARIVVQSVSAGVFDSEKDALQSLFQAASRAKRSKIKSFLTVVRHLDGHLDFPEDMGERLGLQLSRALDETPSLARPLIAALRQGGADAAAEQALIQRVLAGDAGPATSPRTPAPVADRPPVTQPADPAPRRLVPGLTAQTRPDGSLVISGPAFTADLNRELQDWLRARADERRGRRD